MELVYRQRFGDFDPDLQSRIRGFLDGATSADPYQDFAFRDTGDAGTLLVAVLEDGRVSAFGLAVENYLASRLLPRVRGMTFFKGPVIGDVADTGPVLKVIAQFARVRGMARVEVQPQWRKEEGERLVGLARAAGWSVASGRRMATLLVNLTPGEEALLAAMKQETRRKVRKAGRVGVSVRFSKDEDWAAFFRCYRETSSRKDFAALGEREFELFRAKVQAAPDRSALLVAVVDGAVVGGIIVARAGPALHYLYGATRNDGELRNLPIAAPLHWRAMLWAMEMGCRLYDFGGYDPDSPGGVARFKRGFSDDIAVFAPAMSISLKPWANGLAIGVRWIRSLLQR